MPLITVKMYSGRSEEQKRIAAKAIMEAAAQAMGTPETAFTVIMEDVAKEEWQDKVAIPEIEPKKDLVYIRQGLPAKE